MILWSNWRYGINELWQERIFEKTLFLVLAVLDGSLKAKSVHRWNNKKILYS